MLPDIGHLEQEGVQASPLARPPEGFFVHMGRAGCHHHPRQALVLDVFFDQFLSEAGTHELVVAGDFHVGLFARPLRHLFHRHLPSYVGAAVTDVDSNFFAHRLPSCYSRLE